MVKFRFQPPVCQDCGYLPWDCPTCGDYQCNCSAPWTVPTAKQPKRMRQRQHYAPDGTPYKAAFIDGYELLPFPTEEEDEEWLTAIIESGPGL